jgi:HD-GYP domain-containing protein (c-di-GMP phosphodiesterase class II)
MARVLLLGPDRQRAVGVRSLLRQDGYQVVWVRAVDRWRLHEREVQPDLVVAAVGSSEAILTPAPQCSPRRGFPAPILFVQQESDFPRELYVEERLVDRMASPFMGEELLGRVDALIRVRQVIRRQPLPDRAPRWTSARLGLRGFGRQVSSWLRARLPQNARPLGPYLEVAARVAEWADRRDAFEPGHAGRVSSFCAMIAEGLQLNETETSELLRAAMLHDIGKVALPVDILHQRQPLEDTQRRLIRTHPARGAALLRALDPDEQVARVVLCHHEQPDGSGYYRKDPASVPRAAYALAVAEAYDAMLNSHLRSPLTSEAALDILQTAKGPRYDADSVEALVDSLRPRTTCIPISQPGARPTAGAGHSEPPG